jgi:hypothetical protein
MDEGFCTKCGKRVTFPTSKTECEESPDCGPFRAEATIADDVLDRTQASWQPASSDPSA